MKRSEAGVSRWLGEPVDQNLFALLELVVAVAVYQVVGSSMQAVCLVFDGQARDCGRTGKVV